MKTLPNPRYFFPAAVGVAASTIAVSSYLLVHQVSCPAGFDGYYYVYQVDSILRTGLPRLHTITPLAFYIEAMFAWFVGGTIEGIKLAIVVATLCLCVLVYRVSYEDTGDKWAALLGSSVAVLATPFEYIQVEFVKTLFGLVGVFAALVALTLYLRNHRIRFIVAGTCFLLMAALSHKTAACIGLVLVMHFIAHRHGHLEVVSLSSWNEMLRSTAIVSIVTLAVFLLAWCAVIRKHAHFIRIHSHLSSTDLTLVFLPAIIWLSGMQYLLRSHDVASDHLSPAPSFSRGFIAVITILSVVLGPLRFFNLTAISNQISDRACLLMLPFLGVHVGLCVSQLRQRKRRLSSGLCLLLALVLFAPAVPPGITYWKSFPILTTPSAAALSGMCPKDVVIAPHGVEFLLRSQFGLHSASSSRMVQRGGNRYFFVLKSALTSKELPHVCKIDLGAACLIREVGYDIESKENGSLP